MTLKKCLNLADESLANTYVIMKTIYPPGYHQNGFVATQALRHMVYVLYNELLHYI